MRIGRCALLMSLEWAHGASVNGGVWREWQPQTRRYQARGDFELEAESGGSPLTGLKLCVPGSDLRSGRIPLVAAWRVVKWDRVDAGTSGRGCDSDK